MSKKIKDIENLFDSVIDDVNNSMSTGYAKSIPDIITFCEGEEWLAMPHHPTNPIRLFPMQKLILKVFYRGTAGNEDLKLTQEEIKLCEKLGLNDPDKGDVLGKYNSGELFTELVLVWGRRAGKDFVCSVIAAYEAMKLLECEGGDPYSLYEISSANPLNILTVANSGEQAHIAFNEIRDRIVNSPYFSDKIGPEGITSSAIYLLTPKDKESNIERKKKRYPLSKGSVCVVVGHSNSDTLLGWGCIVLILDEVASYKSTGGSASGDRIYAALSPTVRTYVRRKYKQDKDGVIMVDENGQKIVEHREYDGKIITISSPRAKEGKFYELYRSAEEVPSRLMCRLATWEINPTHTRESLRKVERMSETEFNMEYGADFSGATLERFFSDSQVESCFSGHNYKLREMGEPGKVYFAHIDPATSSHNYALLILHKEFYIDQESRKSDFFIVVDHIKLWTPTPHAPVDIDGVDDYIVRLKRKFHIALLTYDLWHSQNSIMRLRKASIPHKRTHFNFSYKNIIYKELENLVNLGKLKIPYHHHLKGEMLELQRRFDSRGFRVFPKKDGDGMKSDDLVDCLSGACFSAISANKTKLPSGRVIEMPTANNTPWKGMQGQIYGYGTGTQVANEMAKIIPGYNTRK